MKTSIHHENLIQAELLRHLGKERIESLPLASQLSLFAEWRDIINDWKAHNGGEVPTASQMEWILGVWHKCPPVEYIDGLTGKNNNN
jgi:hypothetical protein